MLAVLKRPLSIILALLVLLVPVGAFALASAGGQPEVAAEIAAQENTNTETNLDFLFAIYMVTWAGFFVYIFIVSRRQLTIEREIKDLRQLLAEQQSAGKG
jgi:CcmD family protein